MRYVNIKKYYEVIIFDKVCKKFVSCYLEIAKDKIGSFGYCIYEEC